MSTLLAATTPNVQATHPLFKQRGYEGFTHCAPNALGIHGRAWLRQVAFDGYYRNIDSFVAATNRGKRIPTHQTDCCLDMGRIVDMLPVQVPPVAIISALAMNHAQEESFLAKTATENPVKIKIANTTYFILNKPDIRRANLFHRISKEVLVPPQNSVSPNTFVAFSFTVAIITEFLKTNTYPAFITEDQASEADYATLNFNSEEGEDVDMTEAEGFFKRAKVDTKTPEETPAADDVEMEEPLESRTVYSFASLRQAVLTAKPSPMPLKYNVGEPSEVPNMPGRCFPYFDKMFIPDTSTIRNIMSTFFIRNLGETREEQIGQFKALRKGWEDLAKLKVGGELVHILLGVRLALETQTRLFIVQRAGDYAGFCLLGAMWSVTVNSRTYDWVDAETLRVAVNAMSSHSFAVDQIAGILSECSLISHGVEVPATEVKAENLKTAVNMWKAIRARKIDGDRSDRLSSVIGMLAYTRLYQQVSPDSLTWLFGQLALSDDEASDVSEEMPLYIPSNFALYHDRRFQLLCTFGPNAPSFNNTRGSTYVIPPLTEDDPNNKLDPKGRKALPHILVSLKGVGEAYADLNRVLSTRAIYMDLGERAAANRNIILTRENRDKVYEAMRLCFNAREELMKKRTAEIVAVGPTTKRAKMLELKTADDLLELL